MRRVVATLSVAVTLILLTGSTGASGQSTCSFARGFATLRDLVGAQTIGACLEDERFNVENGNAEQQTSGGLLVWRKADNFTAFTDGGTTWVNGPNGLQSRPNGQRFSWELDPTSSASSPPSGPAPSGSPPPSAPPVSAGTVTASSAGAGASASGGLARSESTAASTPASVATSTATSTATPMATPTSATTPTPTPNPVRVRFREKPDEVDTGTDAHFEVETNAKKGTCALTVTYRKSSPVAIGSTEIDDGRCEWKYNLAADTKTGKATAQVTVTAADGTVATTDDTFDVRKGDTTYAGDIEIEIDADDLPNKVSVGEKFEVSIDTNLKNRGACDVAVTWPMIGAEVGGRQTPGSNGRCSWTMTVPTMITKGGKATLTVVVTRNKRSARILTKEFDVRT